MSKLSSMAPPRKPRPALEAVADIDDSSLNEIARTPAPAAKEKAPAGKSKLRKAEAGIRVAVYLPPELEQQLRVHCAMGRQSLSDAATEAFRRYLGEPLDK